MNYRLDWKALPLQQQKPRRICIIIAPNLMNWPSCHMFEDGSHNVHINWRLPFRPLHEKSARSEKAIKNNFYQV